MRLDFTGLTDYALKRDAKALLAGILAGAIIPAPEQPCWDCGQMRYFWLDAKLGCVEQCCSVR